MPQGSSVVKPTNGLYLLPFTSKKVGISGRVVYTRSHVVIHYPVMIRIRVCVCVCVCV